MDSIRKNKNPNVKPRQKPVSPSASQGGPDLSFLKKQETAENQEIVRPRKIFENLLANFNLKVISLVLVILAVVLIFNYVNEQKQFESQPLAQPVSQANDIAEQVIDNPKVSQENDIFTLTDYYKIELVEGTTYYAKIRQAQDHYQLNNIYYEEVQDAASQLDDSEAQANESSKIHNIILVKYGTEIDRPEDELLIPREQVKIISRLAKDSPIVIAINEYLTDN